MRIPTARPPHAAISRQFSRRTFLLAGIGGLTLPISGCRGDRASDELAGIKLDYPDDSMLAGTEWVAQRINNANLRILDCSDLPTYRRGHLPGARHVWWQDTIEIHNPVYGMLVNAQGRAALAQRAGIQPGSEVVCYDADGGVYATRVAWTLRYMGFRNARLLAGGARAWQADGHSLSRAEPGGQSDGIADIFDESIVAHPQDIKARLDEPRLVFLDTRTEPERNETWNGRLRSGMIPGSIWMERSHFLDERGVPAQAERLLDQLGDRLDLDNTAEIIVYGLHGTLAALPYHLLLALNRFHVRLYDGSWSQWGADESLPLAPFAS